MKDRVTRCDGWRQALRLQAGGALAAEQTTALERHLATCTDCRQYAHELRAATSGLRWLASQPVEPSPHFRRRWTDVVEAEPTGGFGELAGSVLDWCRFWLRRNRRPLLTLAPVWALILLFKITASENYPPPSTTVAHSPVEIFRALKAQERLLAGHDSYPEPPPVTPQKTSPDQPRSEAPSGASPAFDTKRAAI